MREGSPFNGTDCKERRPGLADLLRRDSTKDFTGRGSDEEAVISREEPARRKWNERVNKGEF